MSIFGTKAGTRIRWQRSMNGRNPDWLWSEKRWKDEADYYADDLEADGIVALVECPMCHAPRGKRCGVIDYHTPRARAAGEEMLRLHGPRFS